MQERLFRIERDLAHEFYEFYFSSADISRRYLQGRLATIECLHLLDKQVYNLPPHMFATFGISYRPKVVRPGERIAQAVSTYNESVLNISQRTIQNITSCFDPYGRLAKFDFLHRINHDDGPDVNQVHRCIWLLRRLAELKRAIVISHVMTATYVTPKQDSSRWFKNQNKRKISGLMKSKGRGTLLRKYTTVADMELEEQNGVD